MNICNLTNKNKDDWNAFVQAHDEGTFFHLAEWQDILERAFGFQTFYMMAKQGGAVTGILPLALVKRPILGTVLISTPLGVYGGGLGEATVLEQAAIKIAQKREVEYLELRGAPQALSDMSVSDRFATFRRLLANTSEENLKAIPTRQRAVIRKGISFNLATHVSQDVDLFYKLYAISVRNLGTPVFARKYLRILRAVFADAIEVTMITHQNKMLSSVLSFKYKDQILPYYGGGVPEARDYKAFPYMYWKVMERAVDEGIRIFDFGRSMKGSGAYAFKKNFGFSPHPLPYHYYLVNARAIPDLDPDTPRNKMLISVWKKLPVSIANRIGPVLYPVIV